MSGLGSVGENIAAKFLEARGCHIVYRNYQLRPLGEIDIVSLEPDGTLCFVEVKTLKILDPDFSLMPEDNLSRSKIDKLKRAAQMFSAKHPELVREARGYRIDAITIALPKEESNLTYTNKNIIINLYENLS